MSAPPHSCDAFLALPGCRRLQLAEALPDKGGTRSDFGKRRPTGSLAGIFLRFARGGILRIFNRSWLGWAPCAAMPRIVRSGAAGRSPRCPPERAIANYKSSRGPIQDALAGGALAPTSWRRHATHARRPAGSAGSSIQSRRRGAPDAAVEALRARYGPRLASPTRN